MFVAHFLMFGLSIPISISIQTIEPAGYSGMDAPKKNESKGFFASMTSGISMFSTAFAQIRQRVSHHPPVSAGHAENEHVTLKRDNVVLDLVPPPTKVKNLIFGRTWVDSPGEMTMTNLTTGDKVVLYFQPCGWFGAGRYEVDGYNAAEEPKILMTGKWNESMSYQPRDLEGEPLPGTELKGVSENDKLQYTYFAHKLNSFDTAPKKILPSDSRLRPDRYALEKGDLSKSGSEKSSLEEKQIAEERQREAKGHKFLPRWFDLMEEVVSTPWGELEVYSDNGKYSEHRAAADSPAIGSDVNVE